MKLSAKMQHVMERLESGNHWTRDPLTGEHRIYETDVSIRGRSQRYSAGSWSSVIRICPYSPQGGA